MDSGTAKHLSFVINIVYFAIFIALFYAFVRWALPYVAPFLIAFLVAYLLQKPVNFIHRKSKNRIARGVAGTVLVILISAVIITLIALLGVQLTGKLKDFVSFLSSKFSELPVIIESIKNELLDFAGKLPASLSETVTDAVNRLSADNITKSITNALTADNIFSALKSPLSGAWSTVKKLPVTIVAILITIISSCFLTSDYGVIRDFILLQFGERRREKLLKTKQLVFFSIGKIVKSYLLIILITTSELALGLGILKLVGIYKNGYIIAISLLIAIIDIIPVLGTGTVLIPWAVVSFVTKDFGMGIGLIVMYIIITVIRQIIEPKLVAGQFDLPAIVTIASMYIGTRIFGAIGIFLLPITVIILKLLVDEGIIHLFRTKHSVALEEAERTGKDPEEILREEEGEPEKPERSNVGQRIAGLVSKSISKNKK